MKNFHKTIALAITPMVFSSCAALFTPGGVYQKSKASSARVPVSSERMAEHSIPAALPGHQPGPGRTPGTQLIYTYSALQILP
ncbi:hypothetical protein [Sinomicrobium soli]|uniref:hypothetical protein n=1 Tax=Sinomicrobium sp. N-1-3-6 TaxID=2219864 RepID=UPI0011BD6880|nr:hypothetical protein [Sinomicrobium sp. N-1-3-6]